MKIWFQSATALGGNPLYDRYEAAFAAQVKRAARGDTEFKFSGVEKPVPRIDSCYYFEYLNAGQILNNIVRAEREGFDAVAVTCMRSPVFIEAQEIVDLPVVYIKECALSFALMFAKNFSFLSYAEGPLTRRIEEARRLGFAERLLPGATLGVSLEGLAAAFSDPGPLREKVERMAREALRGGAELLIPACNLLSVLLVEWGLRQVEGIPILDNGGVLVKTAEMAVDLKRMGISRTRGGLFPSPTAEERNRVRGLFALNRV